MITEKRVVSNSTQSSDNLPQPPPYPGPFRRRACIATTLRPHGSSPIPQIMESTQTHTYYYNGEAGLAVGADRPADRRKRALAD